MPNTKTADVSALTKAQDDLLPQNVKEQANDLLKQFENVDESQMVGLTADYLEMKVNTTYNMIFLGMTTMNNNGKEIKAVELLDKQNKKFIHASTVLVNSLNKVTKLPCLVRIVTKDLVKSDAGKYLDMDVYVIPATIAK
jgi:uncharacterized protein (UPF0147 family)